ncbi:hypothetical protein GCM10010983_36000 [Caulobacter rhizosphaerae]|nr:hypothetical protein GCM10010983_36000 [Caulobacter rhizosphaerae]
MGPFVRHAGRLRINRRRKMSDRRQQRDPQRQAKAWFETLSGPVSTDDIEAWFAWSRDPACWAAYARLAVQSRRRAGARPFTERELLAALERRADLASAYQEVFRRAGRPADLAHIARHMARRSHRRSAIAVGLEV